MKNFAILGVGGYIAPRHIKAINDTGNRIVAAMDINDSVGILDRYTQDVEFFTDFERFEAHIESLETTERKVDFISICSPNYLHGPHIKFALRNNCEVICEKPLVLKESEIDDLKTYEQRFSRKVNTVLQLRVHDSIVELKNKIQNSSKEKFEVDLCYITSRGPWYHESWKGNIKKSGGLPTNIGIHFFDMLIWLFGDLRKSELHLSNNKIASGYMQLEKANVKWVLSVDKKYLPKSAIEKSMTTYRSITINGDEVEFSGGFTDLHTKIYHEALAGNGFGLEEARPSIRIVDQLRDQKAIGINDNSHFFVKGL